MRNRLILAAAALLSTAVPSSALKPPRQESPAPQELLRAPAASADEEEMARAIAEADRHPLGSTLNPVRVGGPSGARAFIARLHCADGSVPKIGQRGKAGIGAFGTLVDIYPLDCGVAAPGRLDLVMDLYHEEHEENRPPPGFRIDAP